MAKIIILVRILWTAGAQKIAIEEAKTLEKMGHKVKLIFLRTTPSSKYLESKLKDVNYEIFADNKYKPKWIYSYITGLFMPNRKGEGTLDYNLIKKFAKTVNKNDADYIICHDQWAGIAGSLIKKRSTIPYSVMLHEHVSGHYHIPLLGLFAEKTETNILKNANMIFGITEKVSNSVKSAYNMNSIPNYPGMNIQKWVTYSEKKNILLASATWDKDRDPKMYLNIIEQLPKYKLYVAGRWRLREEKRKFQEHIKKIGLEDRVILIGEIPEQELQELYIFSKFNIRFNLQPEWGPGMSNVEAISHLTPIIVNSQLGISNIILRYGGGKVLHGIDVQEAVKFIRQNDNSTNYSALQNQLMEITKNYTWEKHCKELIGNLR